MNWLRVAFGLIREAAGTEIGQEIIQNVRSSARNKASEPASPPLTVEAMIADHRQQVDRNLEAVVAMLNEQNSRLIATIQRQRVWNYALGAGLIIALIAAIAGAI